MQWEIPGARRDSCGFLNAPQRGKTATCAESAALWAVAAPQVRDTLKCEETNRRADKQRLTEPRSGIFAAEDDSDGMQGRARLELRVRSGGSELRVPGFRVDRWGERSHEPARQEPRGTKRNPLTPALSHDGGVGVGEFTSPLVGETAFGRLGGG